MTEQTGRTALITGAGGGIGTAIAHVLAEAGAFVALNDIARDPLERLAGALESGGHDCLVAEGDMTSADTAAAVVDRAATARERLDIVVNAAGICPSGPFAETSEAEWDRVFAVNAKATFLCCREALRHLPEHAGASIVNIASNAGKTAEPFLVPYSASKFAIVGLTQGLALELAGRGIRVNCVCPAMCETDMMQRLAVEYAERHGTSPEQEKRDFHAEIPWGRMARPADIAHAVRFLADPASDFFTGQALNVSGGLELH